MTSKDYLRSIGRRAEVIRAKLEDCEQLRALCVQITPSYSEHSGASGVAEDAKFVKPMIRLIEYEQKLNAKMDEYIAEKQRASEIISHIPDEVQRTVLVLRYFNLLPWEAIADRMHYTQRHVTRLHGIALLSFDKERSRGV